MWLTPSSDPNFKSNLGFMKKRTSQCCNVYVTKKDFTFFFSFTSVVLINLVRIRCGAAAAHWCKTRLNYQTSQRKHTYQCGYWRNWMQSCHLEKIPDWDFCQRHTSSRKRLGSRRWSSTQMHNTNKFLRKWPMWYFAVNAAVSPLPESSASLIFWKHVIATC